MPRNVYSMARRAVLDQRPVMTLVRYYPMDSMVREPYDGIIGDAPPGAIPFHRLFDVVSGSLRRHALHGNRGGE